ncbi:LAME_0E12750g1_1 [Lachancea meyersii CBS 8951]|uniref:LAME_0E12750g1_1 n=1 Tax=Lachancea meyersii CBS 8951 TaxID=1266667 RepID=A0A1G4JM15_9SACH|nr:LAME_0E12750g1_1 [Lachancea meyersii CBS 8951]
MEAIDVQNRSFVVRWLKVSKGDTITFQLKPLKRSVDAGIYRRHTAINNETFEQNGETNAKNSESSSPSGKPVGKLGSLHIAPDTKSLLDYALNRSNSSTEEFTQRNRSKTISAVQHLTQDIPLDKKLTAQGFTQVKWLGTIPGNEFVEGNVQADEDGYYAFVLDNTASKTAKKKILLGVENKTQGPEIPIHRSRSQLVRVKQGRILQGYMLKKRRKKLQGFTKRFFKLDLKYKAFSYYLNEHNNVCRGEIVIPLATVSANKMTRLIIIDSGMEIWVLKAKDESSWSEWIKALQDCYKKEEKKPSATNQLAESSDPTTLLSGLKIIEQKLDQCRAKSLSYYPPVQDVKAAAGSSGQASSVSRTPSTHSLSHIFGKHKNISSEAIHTPSDNQSEKPQQLPLEHQLYRDLGEVEDLVRQWLNYSTNLLGKSMPPDDFSIFSDEFYDAEDDNLSNESEPESADGVIMLNDEEGVNALLLSQNDHTGRTEDNDDDNSSKYDAKFVQKSVPAPSGGDLYPLTHAKKIVRRNDVPEATSTPPSLLSFLRKNVGKDLTSISMPITSNEPITILQMLSETFEYSELLNKAAATSDEVHRMALVAAFTCSYLSMHRSKTRALRKPFNPLLGETFELVREDKGMRLIAEKVSHKPQIFAFHVDHAEWELSYSVSPIQKFWGKSIEFVNEGELKLTFKSTGERYEWSQPTTILKNLFAGERYVEPANHMEVVSSHNVKARVAFKAAGMFSGRSEELLIVIHRGSMQVATLKGDWTKSITNSHTGAKIWEAGQLVPRQERKYGFTQFTANLNEITEMEKDNIPATDSRLRPDLRLYENGDVAEAERLKLELEQQQRIRRLDGKDSLPQYFHQVSNNHWELISGPDSYWERRRRHDWSNVVPLW